jgi:hypothetical protein
VSAGLPESATLAWWGTAWLRGHVVSDDLLDALAAHGRVQTGALDLLAAVRRAGSTQLGLALPVDGDPLGLGGPPRFNLAALGSGEAVVSSDAGLGSVPSVVGAGTTWTVVPAARRSVPDVGEADRGLRRAVLETAQALADLDVARWRPDVADAIMDLHHLPALDPPPGTPARCADLAARALQCTAIVDLASEDPGAAVSA